jgi:hypothetical protein
LKGSAFGVSGGAIADLETVLHQIIGSATLVS